MFHRKSVTESRLNGQTSEWLSIKTGFPQAPLLGPLLLLISINDLSIDLVPTVKFFEDYVSIFSISRDARKTTDELKKRYTIDS